MYVPPARGCTAASWALEMALQYATSAATGSAMSRPTPAAVAAGPQGAYSPAPSIAPNPTSTASARPSSRRSAGGRYWADTTRSSRGAVNDHDPPATPVACHSQGFPTPTGWRQGAGQPVKVVLFLELRPHSHERNR